MLYTNLGTAGEPSQPDCSGARWTPIAICFTFLVLAVCIPHLAGAQPLFKAVETRNIQDVRRMIDSGADINGKDSEGYTPLIFAAELGDYAIAELLVSRGAKMDEANNSKATALHKVLDGDTPALGKQLSAARRRLALLLIERGADVNFAGQNRTTPLHLAAVWGDTAVIKALIQKGADVNAKTAKGRTPLIAAEALRRSDAVTLLRQNGAR